MQRIVDLSQEIFTNSPVYKGHQATVVHRLRDVEKLNDGKWTFAVNALFMSDHCGSHTDSFAHMDSDANATSIEDVPLEMCLGPAVCLDVSELCADAFITAAMLKEAEHAGGFLVGDVSIVLIYTGHYGRAFPTERYGARHPGLDRGAMEWLADRGVTNVGIDCPSIDIEPHSGTEWKPAHSVCRERSMLNTENLGDLNAVAQKKFNYIGLPLKIVGGTAGPIRAIAILDEA